MKAFECGYHGHGTMGRLISGLCRFLPAALLGVVAVVGARAQTPEFGYWERTPLPQTGLATFYDPGLMEKVQDYRLTGGDVDACPECVGSVALLRAGDIGRKVWLQPPGGDPVGPFLVVDCARRQDVQPLLDRNWVVDVSYEVGQFWGMNRPLDGVIVFEDPADDSPGRAANRIPTPFYIPPSDVVISPPTATPPVSFENAALPTAWPTRMPVPLAPMSEAAQGTDVTPTNTPMPPTPTAIWPPPLTPIITTPTPTEVMSLPEDTNLSQPVPIPTEVALGRAGGGLLELSGAPPQYIGLDHGTQPAQPTLVRTPRPIGTPFLTLAAPPTATPTPGANLLDRLLQGLTDLMR
jgi:hypothetical protein